MECLVLEKREHYFGGVSKSGKKEAFIWWFCQDLVKREGLFGGLPRSGENEA